MGRAAEGQHYTFCFLEPNPITFTTPVSIPAPTARRRENVFHGPERGTL